jgi:hypothetical protein
MAELGTSMISGQEVERWTLYQHILPGAARYSYILEGFIGWFLLSIFTVSLINQTLSNVMSDIRILAIDGYVLDGGYLPLNVAG